MFPDLFIQICRTSSVVEVWLGFGNGAIGQDFELAEVEVLLGGDVDVAGNNWERLTHHGAFSQCIFIGLLEDLKCGLREL